MYMCVCACVRTRECARQAPSSLRRCCVCVRARIESQQSFVLTSLVNRFQGVNTLPHTHTHTHTTHDPYTPTPQNRTRRP